MKPFNFGSAFKAMTGHSPFPWQRRLFQRLSTGNLPPAVDVPTGLGKTAVMAIWLLARATGAPLPRRLVYVVDRRAVVDQATDFAVRLREALSAETLKPVRHGLGLTDRALPISTLRGQHVDNREWLDDPTAPAIIVGTVDMVGSRLLFEGYGVSRRMRPYHAGLLGCDALVLLDEAHLSRPFEQLLRTIEAEQRPAEADGSTGSRQGKFAGHYATANIPPAFRMLPLSATLSAQSGDAFTLDQKDRANETVRARLEALKTLVVKRLGTNTALDAALAERAWKLAQLGAPNRMLIYCDRRQVAESVKKQLTQRAKQAKTNAAVILFVGGRRVHEREAAAQELRQHGLLVDSDGRSDTPVFLVATSAGEVGVDLDADHMVCDLVAWERMVQRLGRVNRRGLGSARVVVIDQGPQEKRAGETGIASHAAVKGLLKDLPLSAGGHQAGPAALAGVGGSQGRHTQIHNASTPMPLYPALTRPLIDAWAMTSLPEHGGRPDVGPWLRGWEQQEPQTTVVWRRCLPVRVEPAGGGIRTVAHQYGTVKAFFEAASPHTAERLETETWRVVRWLRKRAKTLADIQHQGRDSEAAATTQDKNAIAERTLTAPLHAEAPVAFVLGGDGELKDVLTLRDATKLPVKELGRKLVARLVVVDARICGLKDGLLDTSSSEAVVTAEDGWGESGVLHKITQGSGPLPVGVRVLSDKERSRLLVEGGAAGANVDSMVAAWQEVWAAPYRLSDEGQAVTWLIVERWRATAQDEDSRAMAPVLQCLEEHREAAAREADRIAAVLELADGDRTMLVAAARHHDDGKRAPRWQRAFNAPRHGGPYAKTPGPINRHVLNGYRHELQSMLDSEAHGLDGVDRSDPRFELALHMIAAHHGHARPAIRADGFDRLPPTAATHRAFEVGQRFARLQRQWGPWGLAWWEALLRAADQRASRALDELARRDVDANAGSSNRGVHRVQTARPSVGAGKTAG